MNTNNNDKSTFLRIDEDEVINTKYIRWMKRIDNCIYICNKDDCTTGKDILRICKYENIDNFNYLDNFFDKKK